MKNAKSEATVIHQFPGFSTRVIPETQMSTTAKMVNIPPFCLKVSRRDSTNSGVRLSFLELEEVVEAVVKACSLLEKCFSAYLS
jgi:hypothetical protein